MIKFTFKGPDGDIKVDAPNSWEEVKVSHFVNPLFLSGDSLGLLSALSGIDRGILLNSKADIEGQLVSMVAFLKDNPKGYTAKEKPESFKLRDRELSIPKDIELETVGQKILFQDAMAKHKFIYEGIPEAIAIYLAPQLNNGVFDDAILPDLIEEIKELRIVDCFPVADFFLNSFRSLTKSGPPSSKTSPV